MSGSGNGELSQEDKLDMATDLAFDLDEFFRQQDPQYAAELARETTVESPDDFLTGETIKTPRGTFHVTD